MGTNLVNLGKKDTKKALKFIDETAAMLKKSMLNEVTGADMELFEAMIVYWQQNALIKAIGRRKKLKESRDELMSELAQNPSDVRRQEVKRLLQENSRMTQENEEMIERALRCWPPEPSGV